jgi:hypothetical protein
MLCTSWIHKDVAVFRDVFAEGIVIFQYSIHVCQQCSSILERGHMFQPGNIFSPSSAVTSALHSALPRHPPTYAVIQWTEYVNIWYARSRLRWVRQHWPYKCCNGRTMRPIRCGVVLEEQPFRRFSCGTNFKSRTFGHFSVLNKVSIVHCCPRRQDVQKSNAFPIAQNLAATLYAHGALLYFFFFGDILCHHPVDQLWNSGSEWFIQLSFPVIFQTGSFHLLYHVTAKCQWRLYRCLLCECVSIHVTLRTQARPLLCSVKTARSFCGNYTRCSWIFCIVIFRRCRILLMATLTDVMSTALAEKFHPKHSLFCGLQYVIHLTCAFHCSKRVSVDLVCLTEHRA